MGVGEGPEKKGKIAQGKGQGKKGMMLKGGKSKDEKGNLSKMPPKFLVLQKKYARRRLSP